MSVSVHRGRAGFDVVAVAASYGGPGALATLLGALPAGMPAAVLVCQHRPAVTPDRFPSVLGYRSALPVRELQDGDRLRPGVVHVVPAKRATRPGPGGVMHVAEPDPADTLHPADSLFTSIAAVHGPRVIAVILTGRLDDGAQGARSVKGAGGRVLVQEPGSCAAAGMPTAALATGCVDHALPLPVLADAIAALVMAPGAASLMRVGLPNWAHPAPVPVPAGARARNGAGIVTC